MAQHPIRVMIVENSTVVRRLLTHIISQDSRLAVVAAVGSAEEALSEVARVEPDVISMDIRLPGMDGLEATRRLMTTHPTPIVVIADAVEDDALKISMNALKAGALSVVEKPSGLGSESYAALADTICTQLRIMSEVPVIRQRAYGNARTSNLRTAAAPDLMDNFSPSVIGMAASTGGPPALAKILGMLPASFPIPILLVQHMGAAFMEGFASWLDMQTPLDVRIAVPGVLPRPGTIHVAPGNRHLGVGPGGVLRLLDTPALLSQRPSANVLFELLARHAGASALGILLTGMGEDGAQGLADMRKAGSYTITEDESTCVVYGMPAAAVRLSASRVALPLDFIAPLLLRMAQASTSLT